MAGKRIIVGICGGIAAYKSVLLVRELVKQGAEVKVVLTPSAKQFVTELTLSVLSKNSVLSDIFQGAGEGTWHISSAQWADLIIIAPATVNTIAKLAIGFADNALTTLLMARRSPVILCPAADEDMYLNPLHQKNLTTLEQHGFYVLPAESGELASTLSGLGRMPTVEKIVDAIKMQLLGRFRDLQGIKLLVTAGPTYEDIDPVRYIGNRSSGKMGYEIAKAAFLRGADVTLISGPSSESSYQEIKLTKVRSAAEMQQAVQSSLNSHDALVMAAAVADFRPVEKATGKIKKGTGSKTLTLTETSDILVQVANSGKVVVGFALETENEELNAAEKLRAKNLDIIVLNSMNEEGAGFEGDTNRVTIFMSDGNKHKLSLLSKLETAHYILDSLKQVITRRYEK